jgi:ribosomal protein S18 acetylase RimI-like enzyme
MAILLRPSSPADEPFLAEVYASTRTEELAPVPWSGEQKRAFLRDQFELQHRYYQEHYVGARFDVIERDGERVGRFYIARWPQEIRIVDISLLPAHRNAGIGSALLRELMDECSAHGKRLTIHVERMNRARRLYERLGFTEVADRGVYAMMAWSPPVAGSPPLK